MKKQPWIHSPVTDGLFILAPPFACLLLVALLPQVFANGAAVSEWWWLALVLCIDVAHVYSTLYRTYFHRPTFEQQRSLLLLLPVMAFAGSVLLYSLSPILFWKLLAYLAVFHFVRQQYGFMRIYARQEPYNKWYRRIDSLAIYTATLYPILYWHLHAPRQYDWFTEYDFFTFQSPLLAQAAWVWYGCCIVAYLIKEAVFAYRHGYCNLPRNALVAGTFLSWYMGIVHFNGDLVFTLLNVVSHGVPYMALVWAYGKKQAATGGTDAYQPWAARLFRRYGAWLFVGSLLLLALAEEGAWDVLVWHEHDGVFAWLKGLRTELGREGMRLVVPLLTLPQLTHYLIDGFIWKLSKGHVPVEG
jgi:hypothetical protein